MRDKVIIYNGKTLLIDTAVLPTVLVSEDGGENWTMGYGLKYAASKFGIDLHADYQQGKDFETFWKEVSAK